MTEQQLKLNLIARTFGTTLMKSGIGMIRSGYEDYEIINSSLRLANDALDKIGLKISVNALDISYYYTTWENWQTIIDVLYGIIKDFKWEADKFDCDNRSNLMTSLCSLLFRINTCAGLYCKVLNLQTGIKYLHWANIIFTKDGKVYLFDVDNFGKYQQIISSDIIMGQNKYTPISIRIY